MLPKVTKSYQMLPKVTKSYKSCQKIPKVGNSYQKLAKVTNSWQKLPKVTKKSSNVTKSYQFSIKFVFGTVCCRLYWLKFKQLPKHHQKRLKCSNCYQMLPKVTKSYQKLPKVIQTNQKLPKIIPINGKSYQKLAIVTKSYQQILPKVSNFPVKFVFDTVCLQTVMINSINYWLTIFLFGTTKSIQLMYGERFHEYGIKPLHKCKMRPYISVRWDLTWM